MSSTIRLVAKFGNVEVFHPRLDASCMAVTGTIVSSSLTLLVHNESVIIVVVVFVDGAVVVCLVLE
jgi:hypothetical protein